MAQETLQIIFDVVQCSFIGMVKGPCSCGRGTYERIGGRPTCTARCKYPEGPGAHKLPSDRRRVPRQREECRIAQSAFLDHQLDEYNSKKDSSASSSNAQATTLKPLTMVQQAALKTNSDKLKAKLMASSLFSKPAIPTAKRMPTTVREKRDERDYKRRLCGVSKFSVEHVILRMRSWKKLSYIFVVAKLLILLQRARASLARSIIVRGIRLPGAWLAEFGYFAK